MNTTKEVYIEKLKSKISKAGLMSSEIKKDVESKLKKKVVNK